MQNRLNAWESHTNADELAAARRASITSARNAWDAAMRYNIAMASGDPAQIAAAQATYRQAWESDFRTKGGQFFGETAPTWVGFPIVGAVVILWLLLR